MGGGGGGGGGIPVVVAHEGGYDPEGCAEAFEHVIRALRRPVQHGQGVREQGRGQEPESARGSGEEGKCGGGETGCAGEEGQAARQQKKRKTMT